MWQESLKTRPPGDSAQELVQAVDKLQRGGRGTQATCWGNNSTLRHVQGKQEEKGQ